MLGTLVNDKESQNSKSGQRVPAICPALHENTDVRESMRILPRWLQYFLTELTGKPLNDEIMPRLWTPGRRLAMSLTLLAASVSGSITLLHASPIAWLFLPLTWLITVSASRSFQTSYVHHASHNNLFHKIWLDNLVAETLSTLVWIQPLSLYGKGHPLHHGRLATTLDPDLQFLVELGLRPGLTMEGYWRQLFRLMISPKFHAVYLLVRLRANFVEAPPLRRMFAVIYTAGLLLVAGLTGSWVELAIAWLIPVLPLYHISGFLQMLTEHNWVRVGHGVDKPKIVLSKLTTARFQGEHVPDPQLPTLRRYAAWVRWWVRMLSVYLAARLFVVQLDLPNHDWHHRYPNKDWANSAYARRDDVLQGTPGWPPYREFWGLRASLAATFELLAQLPPDAVLGDPLTYRDREDIMLGM
jgi:hypothetical protein